VTQEAHGKPRAGPGGARSAPPAFTRPIHCNLEEVGKVPFLPRYALACWWSIVHLIRTEPKGTVWFWTFTSPSAIPLWWFSERHSNLVRNVGDVARGMISSHVGTIPKNWGGVRVFEHNPLGTGFHSHWVIRGWCDWYTMQHCALKAGLGKVVWVDPKPATEKTAWYLASYLLKGEKLAGARKWANIGTYDGIGGRDIEYDSQRIRDIRAWQVHYRALGKHRFLAYQMAIRAVDDGLPLPGTAPF